MLIKQLLNAGAALPIAYYVQAKFLIMPHQSVNHVRQVNYQILSRLAFPQF
jgi:hypothetical protein